MFARFKTKSKLIVIVVIAVIATGAYAAVFILVGRIEKDVAAAAAKTAADAVNLERQAQTRSVLANTSAQQAQIAAYALTPDGVVAFIDGIETTARNVHLVESTDSVTAAPFAGLDQKKWEALSMSLTTDGSWADTYRFLAILENLPLRSTVTRASIERTDINQKDKTAVESWHGDFTVVVLKRK